MKNIKFPEDARHLSNIDAEKTKVLVVPEDNGISEVSVKQINDLVEEKVRNNFYDKSQVDNKIDNVDRGIQGNIKTSQTTAELNALQDGVWECETSGTYNTSSVAANRLVAKEGYLTKFEKKGTVWMLFSEVEMPKIEIANEAGDSTTAAISQDFASKLSDSIDDINNSPALTSIKIISNRDYLIGFIDGDGKVLGGFKKSGDFVFNNDLFNILNQNGVEIDDLKIKVDNNTLNLSKINDTLKIISNRDWLFALVDNESKVIFGAKKDGNLLFNSSKIDNLSSSLSNITSRVVALENKEDVVSNILIRAWGDSLTSGAGGNILRYKDIVLTSLTSKGYGVSAELLRREGSTPYPRVIEKLLNDNEKYTIFNQGVGGESINTIISRNGAIPAIFNQDVLLPTNTTDLILVGNRNTNPLKSSYDESNITPLIQGNGGNTVNPMFIEGQECTLSYNSVESNYYLKRNKAGLATTIKRGTPIIMNGSNIARNTDIAVIWCFQNGGYTSNEDLIYKLNRLIDNISTDKYVIIGLHTGTESSRALMESELSKTYGQKFFNWRRYVSQHALYEWGITPTTDADFTADQLANGVKSDVYQMSIGALPSSFWSSIYGADGATTNDFIHITSACYIILGYKLVELFSNLGYINK